MEVIFRKSFQKDFDKLQPKLQDTTEERVKLFKENPYDQRLDLHPLRGNWEGFYSIDIAFNLRGLFYFKENCAIFVRVGTHSQLYK